MKVFLSIVFILFTLTKAYAQPYDTLHVYFPLNKTQLTDESNKFLDSIITKKVIKPGSKMILLGFGDYLGDNEYNKDLSYQRAKNVLDYLVVSGFNKQDITMVIGKGKITRKDVSSKQGNAIDRKVDIIVDKVIDTPISQKFVYYMRRLKVDETIPLHMIQFFRGSLRMMPESMPELNMLIDFMLQNPTYKIQVEGHVCCMPWNKNDEPYDESTLSEKRARSVCDSLIVHGVDKERLKYIGLGKTNPIADPEITEEDQALNRRVEVRILSK